MEFKPSGIMPSSTHRPRTVGNSGSTMFPIFWTTRPASAGRAGPDLVCRHWQNADPETPNRSHAPAAPADGPDRLSPPAPAATDLFDDRPVVSPPRPPTLMTRHPIAQFAPNGNLKLQSTDPLKVSQVASLLGPVTPADEAKTHAVSIACHLVPHRQSVPTDSGHSVRVLLNPAARLAPRVRWVDS